MARKISVEQPVKDDIESVGPETETKNIRLGHTPVEDLNKTINLDKAVISEEEGRRLKQAKAEIIKADQDSEIGPEETVNLALPTQEMLKAIDDTDLKEQISELVIALNDFEAKLKADPEMYRYEQVSGGKLGQIDPAFLMDRNRFERLTRKIDMLKAEQERRHELAQ